MNGHKLKNLIQLLATPPQRIFLIDGLGALLSTALILILTKINHLVGMPQNTLFILAGIAFVFCIYSLSCFYFKFKNSQALLKLIIIANLSYGLLTMVLVFYHSKILMPLGFIYFILELLVLIILSWVEISVYLHKKES